MKAQEHTFKRVSNNYFYRVLQKGLKSLKNKEKKTLNFFVFYCFFGVSCWSFKEYLDLDC